MPFKFCHIKKYRSPLIMVNIIYKCKWSLSLSPTRARSHIRAACCGVFHTLKVENGEKDMKSLPPKVRPKLVDPPPLQMSLQRHLTAFCCSSLDVCFFPFVLAVIKFVFFFLPAAHIIRWLCMRFKKSPGRFRLRLRSDLM